MQVQEVDFLLNEATQLLQTANDELSHSEEDVTTYMVCQNSRQALINSMTYFLFKNGITPKEPVTMEHLLNQCKEKDARFQKVNMSNILCRHEENSNDYCLPITKVNSCFKSAQLIHGLVTDAVPG